MKRLLILYALYSLLLYSVPANAGVMIVSSTPVYDNSDAMAQNLDRAIEKLNGKVIARGQTFSFNEAIGPRTDANGFAVAANGNGVAVSGGGVSQVATTLYTALKELGREIAYDEKNTFADTFSGGYVEKATDAVLTDYSRGLDFRFTSNHAENLSLSTWRSGGTVFCQLTGTGTTTAAPEATPGTEASSQPTGAPTLEYETLYVVNVEHYVNLRSEPSIKAEPLAQIPKGAAVQFTAQKIGEFLQVLFDGKTGYAHMDYLSPEKPK